jgi:hypothetical protein
MDKKEEIALKILRDETKRGKPYRLEVTGHWSMYPLFQKHGFVHVKGVNVEDLRTGDVVVYKNGGDFVAHRCLRVLYRQEARLVITKGDNSLLLDPYEVGEKDILGKIVSFTVNGKTVGCDNFFWGLFNKTLAAVSFLQASYYACLYKINLQCIPFVCLKKALMFAGRIGREIRAIPLKLLVLWIGLIV